MKQSSDHKPLRARTAAIGVDIGGTNIKLGLVAPDGRVLLRGSFQTRADEGRAGVLGRLVENILAVSSAARQKGWGVKGVGIGAPGPVDVRRGWVYFFPNLPGWKNTPLKAILERRLRLPVAVDNDANVMALAEFRFGAGRGADPMVALTLGTGIGGGLVIGGRLFHGPAYSAAELGHISIQEDGPLCGCGSRGCVETYVGNGYFVRELKKRLKAASAAGRGRTRRRFGDGGHGLLEGWVFREKRELTPKLAALAARKGDPVASKLWEETGERLGTMLAGLVNALNPQKIVLGGGVAQSGSLLFGPVVRTIGKKAFPIAARSVRVVPAAFGVDAGVVGAAALLFEGRNKP
ncbi:MAG: ROK family protein [Candidatus Omnitrophica bacterium]|nr:ROK family protein [Candidatus Omnitrophota bacterium]